MGTFPWRKPGILRLPARSEAAWSIACSTSPLGTSTVIRTLLSGSSSTVAFTERPLCQPTSGPAQALQEPDQEQDDENQQKYATTDVHLIPSFRSWTRMGGEREIPRLRAVHTSIRRAMRDRNESLKTGDPL